jgi:hypothetical protein
MAVTNAQVLASQLEKVRPNLSKLFSLEDSLFTKLQTRPKEEVSTRPYRVPFLALSGGKSRSAGLDGADLGRGGGPSELVGLVAPVYFNHNLEWTKLAEIATDNKQKAINDYAKLILKNGMEQFRSNLDSLVASGNGSNTLDTVVSYDGANFIVYVTTPNRFYDGQDVDVYTALGTAIVGTFTIFSVDAGNKALYLAGAPGFALAATNLLLENASAGTANSGINGVLNLQQNTATGTFLGVPCASAPGKLVTPHVNAANLAITPGTARLLLNQMKIARGIDMGVEDGSVFFMNLDQQAAWENTGIVVTQNIMQYLKQDSSQDMLKKNSVETIAGTQIMASNKAQHQRIDLLPLKHWFRTEIQPIDYFDAGGQTVFVIYGASGAPSSTMWTSLIWGGNVASDNPRAGAFMDNLAATAGY